MNEWMNIIIIIIKNGIVLFTLLEHFTLFVFCFKSNTLLPLSLFLATGTCFNFTLSLSLLRSISSTCIFHPNFLVLSISLPSLHFIHEIGHWKLSQLWIMRFAQFLWISFALACLVIFYITRILICSSLLSHSLLLIFSGGCSSRIFYFLMNRKSLVCLWSNFRGQPLKWSTMDQYIKIIEILMMVNDNFHK